MTLAAMADTLDAIVAELYEAGEAPQVYRAPRVVSALTERGESLLRELRLAVHREVRARQLCAACKAHSRGGVADPPPGEA